MPRHRANLVQRGLQSISERGYPHWQRVAVHSDPEVVEAKRLSASRFRSNLTQVPVQSAIASTPQPLQAKGNGKDIPSPLRSKMERAFNTNFSDVRIHEGNQAPSIGALAYTQGNQIHFAPGKFNPHSSSGQVLLGHELAHVVQQRQGRVKPTSQIKGLPMNDQPFLEREADKLGRKAAQA